MDLSWLWYGFIIFVCLALMVTVMWLTDKGIEKAQKVWSKIFQPLNP